MKRYNLLILLALLLVGLEVSGQSTETFETEPIGSPSFSDLGETFNITSGESYDINQFADAGWNGTANDNRFVDNSSNTTDGGGTGFTIKQDDDDEFLVIDLYLFCSRHNLSVHSGTLTITGRKNGSDVYSITKNTGFSNTTTFTPNNGFTYIDFATEGAADYTDDPIDELVFSSSGNLDYMALDAFQWNSAPLPVELTRFDGLVAEKTVSLTWETERESNNGRFEIERSQNGRDFNKIGEVAGGGTTSETQQYLFTDQVPFNGNNYYRLKQIDYDGQFDISNVINIRFKESNELAGDFYPNPSKSGLIALHYTSNITQDIDVSVYDMTGKLVASLSKFVSIGANTLDFNFSALTTGTYIVKLEGVKKSIERKVIIEK